MATSGRPRGGAERALSPLRLRASFVLPTKALFHVCHLRRMGYMLARPCRRCGCGIAVNSVQLKIDKDGVISPTQNQRIRRITES